MATTPRLAWPLQLADGQLAVVEQDSDQDIVQCIRAIVGHRPGDRVDLPEMGILDPTFGEQPLDTEAIADVVRRHEPRVDALATATPDTVDNFIVDVALSWRRRDTPEDPLG